MKKIDNIIIIIFIINLILFVFLLIWNPEKTNDEENVIYNEGYDQDIEEYVEDTTIYIDNIADFTSNYSGDFTPAEVNSVVSSYVNGELKNIYKESNNIGFKKYFKNNKEDIKAKLGITDSSNFEIFMKHIAILENGDIESASLRESSLIERDYNVEYILDIVLNTQEKISINVQVNRYNNDEKPMITVSPVEEETTNEE